MEYRTRFSADLYARWLFGRYGCAVRRQFRSGRVGRLASNLTAANALLALDAASKRTA